MAIEILNKATRDAVIQLVRDEMRNKPVLGDLPRRRRPIPRNAESSTNRVILGTITAVTGTAGSPKYSAVALSSSDITVSNAIPNSRPFPSIIDLTPAQVGDACILYKFSDDVWRLWDVVREACDPTACQAAQQEVTPNANVIDGYTEFPQDMTQPTLSITSFSHAFSVSGSTNEQYGVKIATFPAGFIKFNWTVMDFTVSAPTITDDVEFSFATNDATGQTGTSFASDYENVCLQLDTVTLSSGGTAYSRENPAVSSASADADNVAPLHDGTSSAVELYLNIADSGTWSGSEDVTVEGEIHIDWQWAGGV